MAEMLEQDRQTLFSSFEIMKYKNNGRREQYITCCVHLFVNLRCLFIFLKKVCSSESLFQLHYMPWPRQLGAFVSCFRINFSHFIIDMLSPGSS